MSIPSSASGRPVRSSQASSGLASWAASGRPPGPSSAASASRTAGVVEHRDRQPRHLGGLCVDDEGQAEQVGAPVRHARVGRLDRDAGRRPSPAVRARRPLRPARSPVRPRPRAPRPRWPRWDRGRSRAPRPAGRRACGTRGSRRGCGPPRRRSRPSRGRRSRPRARRRAAAPSPRRSRGPGPRARRGSAAASGVCSSRLREDAVEPAVLVDELGRGLLADARARRAGCRTGRRAARRTRRTRVGWTPVRSSMPASS